MAKVMATPQICTEKVMRGKGEGSIYKRKDGMWVGSIELNPRPGNPRPRKVVTARLKSDLIIKFEKAKAEAKRNGDMPTSSQSVEQWMTEWLERIAVKELRPKTMANYRSFTKNHILPVIGNVKLDRLTPRHVMEVTDRLEESHSGTTAKTAHAIMSSAFRSAEEWGRISSNPAHVAKAPRTEATSLEVLDLEEVGRLIGQFRGDAERYLWAVFILTGARRGEILGLQWDRVTDVLDLQWQLQRHPVNIVAPADYEYQRLSGGLYLTRPKTKKSTRVVPLVPPLSGILAQWKEIAPANPHGLVFATAGGEPIDPDFASKQWPKILEAAGITKHIRLHDLRHSAVDLLYGAGVDVDTIMEIVGHSTRAMTREYKSRGNRPQLTDAMTKMSALLGIESLPHIGG